ncbi:MAG: hypothetical protein WKG07_35065 [Hymenobacter sp.]
MDYAVSQFKQNGVAPAGERGSLHCKAVRLRRAFVEPGAAASYQPASGAAQPLAVGPAIVLSQPRPGRGARSRCAAGVCRLRHHARPELKYDDYAGLDVRGKMVVIARRRPRQLADNERRYFTDLRIGARNRRPPRRGGRAVGRHPRPLLGCRSFRRDS